VFLADFRSLCKFLAIKDQDGLGRPLKNVLTAKKGCFSGVLEEKQGVRARKIAFYFAFFHFFMLSCICKFLSDRTLRQAKPSKKNRAQKPTVGFPDFGIVPKSPLL
jgi:hypothetical protein